MTEQRCGLCDRFMADEDYGRCAWLEQQEPKPEWMRHVRIDSQMAYMSGWSGQGCRAFVRKGA